MWVYEAWFAAQHKTKDGGGKLGIGSKQEGRKGGR